MYSVLPTSSGVLVSNLLTFLPLKWLCMIIMELCRTRYFSSMELEWWSLAVVQPFEMQGRKLDVKVNKGNVGFRYSEKCSYDGNPRAK